ncbi:hypothetical protein GCM10023094_44180 [Rhodococcus olei]|uniref:DUF2505 domain-containing protein n=1 Tax=Rhodococcus olei TaxID=2161675 RepID=A0ABP8PFV4_9NOCA
MSRRIEFTANYSLPAEVVHRTLTAPAFWNDRVAKGADSGVTLTRLESGPGTIDVAVNQVVDTSALPSIVTKLIKGDLAILRSENWSPVAGGSAAGSFAVDTTGIPVTVRGTYTLTDVDGGSTLTGAGEVDVNVKLIGGTIEGMVVDQVRKIFETDQEAVEEWAAANA